VFIASITQNRHVLCLEVMQSTLMSMDVVECSSHCVSRENLITQLLHYLSLIKYILSVLIPYMVLISVLLSEIQSLHRHISNHLMLQTKVRNFKLWSAGYNNVHSGRWLPRFLMNRLHYVTAQKTPVPINVILSYI
jgi:hypothetical protein